MSDPKERPILFSAEMVRAILEGRKTQTRRAIKLRHDADVVVVDGKVWKPDRVDYAGYVDCPRGQPGDLLWVRETWANFLGDDHILYRATNDPSIELVATWKPSIHMPRWASRILLQITNVRVERLQEISEADAIAEGVELFATPAQPRPSEQCLWKDYLTPGLSEPSAKRSYASLWDSINGEGSWTKNPWVWVVEFSVNASQ
ncbi:MAG: hypothetical protein PHV02_03235 [Rhodocyclaceae bacterium]|nr:hypothetical protein [Rhodocyclaceae bacterium]